MLDPISKLNLPDSLHVLVIAWNRFAKQRLNRIEPARCEIQIALQVRVVALCKVLHAHLRTSANQNTKPTAGCVARAIFENRTKRRESALNDGFQEFRIRMKSHQRAKIQPQRANTFVCIRNAVKLELVTVEQLAAFVSA
jgi:hypothetical protein